MTGNVSADSLLVERLPAAQGKFVVHAQLHAPATLNSLTTSMVEQLLQGLDTWAADDSVACVLVSGSGDKAFCAGGDVQMLRNSSLASPGGPCVEAEHFFAREYRMNYAIHTYAKPVVVWGDGIVMGGGLGILAGASHRVVTETSRFAMPEVTIALFPDVGGSFFLNLMPGRVGRFLALTGASFNAADALYTGLADFFVQRDAFARFTAQLQQAQALDSGVVGDALGALQRESIQAMPAGNVEARRETMESLCASEDTAETCKAIAGWQGSDKWLARARDGQKHGSPLASLWIDQQLKRAEGLPLKQVFQSELVLATNIVRHGEFAEGVRALLVDKDKNPAWQFPGIDAIPAGFVDRFFEPPWPENPLADL